MMDIKALRLVTRLRMKLYCCTCNEVHMYCEKMVIKEAQYKSQWKLIIGGGT